MGKRNKPVVSSSSDSSDDDNYKLLKRIKKLTKKVTSKRKKRRLLKGRSPKSSRQSDSDEWSNNSIRSQEPQDLDPHQGREPFLVVEPQMVTEPIQGPQGREPTPALEPQRGRESPPRRIAEQEVLEIHVEEDLLHFLGAAPNEEVKLGANLLPEVALRWDNFAKMGMPEADMLEVIKKYPMPANCSQLQAPKINAELLPVLSDAIKKRDNYFVDDQRQLSTALTAVGNTLSMLLTNNELNKPRAVENLSDAGKMLADLQHKLSKCRAAFIVPNLNKSVQNLVSKGVIDDFLFGRDLSERLKEARSFEKSSLELNLGVTPQAKKPAYKQHLNYQAPSQSQKREGGTRRQPDQAYRSRPSSGKVYRTAYSQPQPYKYNQPQPYKYSQPQLAPRGFKANPRSRKP